MTAFINRVSAFEVVLVLFFQLYVGEQQEQGAPHGGTSWEPRVAPRQAVPSPPRCRPGRHGATGPVGAGVGVPGWAPQGY